MVDEMKACPFCESKPSVIQKPKDSPPQIAAVGCRNRNSDHVAYATGKSLIEAWSNWNTRTPLSSDAEVEAAAEGVKAYLAEHTGFVTDEGEGIVASYYGGHWFSLDTRKIGRAAIEAMRSLEGKE